MRGTLILRLVDITLLLLLSLMAAAAIQPEDILMPVTKEMEDRGRAVRPLRVVLTATGEAYIPEVGKLPLEALPALFAAGMGTVEFIADRSAPAGMLVACHRAARRAGWRAVFLVERHTQ